MTLRRYDLGSTGIGEGWATIVLDLADGYFSAVSDFDNYAFRWANHNCADFRIFLIRVTEDPDQFIRKLSPGTEIDYDASWAALVAHVDATLADPATVGAARNAYLRDKVCLAQHEGHFPDREDAWCEMISENILEVEDPTQFLVRVYPHMVQRFVRETMMRLADVLRAELANEAGTENPPLQRTP